MGNSLSEKANENASSHHDDSTISEPSIDNNHGKSPKSKSKTKKGNKRNNGSGEWDRMSSDGHLGVSTPKSILTGSSSRRESMTSNFSSVSERINDTGEDEMEIEKYSSSPKKYRTFQRAAKPNPKPEKVSMETKKTAKLQNKAELNGSYEIISDEPESFVVVPAPAQLEKYDTNQKLGDIPCVGNNATAQSKTSVANSASGKSDAKSITSNSRQAKLDFFNASTARRLNEPQQMTDQGFANVPHVQVSISKQIRLRELEHSDLVERWETDLDQCSKTSVGGRGLNNYSENPQGYSDNPHGRKTNNLRNPSNVKSSDKTGNPKKGSKDIGDYVSSANGENQPMLDLTEIVHIDKTGAMGEKLQRCVPNDSAELGRRSADQNRSWPSKRPGTVTPNTKANNKTAALYGTLPRGQMQSSRLLQRGGVMQTNLDEYEMSKSADALHEIGSTDESSRARKSLFSLQTHRTEFSAAAKRPSDLSSDVVTDEAAESSFRDIDSSTAAVVTTTVVSTAPRTNLATSVAVTSSTSHATNADKSVDLNDPDLDIYSSPDRTPQEMPSKDNKSHFAAMRMKHKIVNIGEKKPIGGYGEREWKGQTPKAKAMRLGYAQIPTLLKCNNVRSIRGDNYCAIRASLYQALVNNYIDIRLGQDLQNIAEVPDWFMNSGYDWINSWTFAHRLTRYTHPVKKMKDCLKVLQEQVDLMKSLSSVEEREKRLLQVFNSEDTELDIQLMEAIKLLMLYNAVRLHEDSATGKEVPVFVWLMYARDTSETPEKLMLHHLNLVGDSGGLEQVEMFLLGFTLGVTLKVVRPSQYKQEDFITHYPDDHVADWPSVTMIAEDDRHYNIAV